MPRTLTSGLIALATLTAAAAARAAGPSTPGLLLWLDGTDSSTITTDATGGVLAWQNKAPGASNAVTYSGADDNATSPAYNAAAPKYVTNSNGKKVVDFARDGYLDNLNFSSAHPASMTIFVLASIDSNPGGYSALMAFRSNSAVNDYQTGLNIDQGEPSSTQFNRINVEGSKAGGNGGFDLLGSTFPFGDYDLYEIDYGGGPSAGDSLVTVKVNGTVVGTLNGSAAASDLTQLYIGTRAYTSGGVPTANHDLDGQIGEVLVYDHQLNPDETAQTIAFLGGAVVPEPATALLPCALAPLLLARRRPR